MSVDKALLVLVDSDLWSDRVRAGKVLSPRAGKQEVDDLLRQLLISKGDTAVIAATADALLGAGTLAALRVFVSA